MRPFRVLVGLVVLMGALLTTRYTLALLNYPNDFAVLAGWGLTLLIFAGLASTVFPWISWAFPSPKDPLNDLSTKEKKNHE